MEKVIIGSMRKSAGKTSAIVGIVGAGKKKVAYIKPFGIGCSTVKSGCGIMTLLWLPAFSVCEKIPWI